VHLSRLPILNIANKMSTLHLPSSLDSSDRLLFASPVTRLPLCVSCTAWQPGGVQESMKTPAALALVFYAAGIPLSFFYFLVKHRKGIQADQALKLQGLGNSAATNTNYHIRRRLQKLYRYRAWAQCMSRAVGRELFRPVPPPVPVVCVAMGAPSTRRVQFVPP
jgi:hypothetical protein